MKIQFILKWCILVMLLVYGQYATAQQGINYEQLSFQDALEKAGKEKKLVFMDAYTKWCTICKMVDKDVFSQKKVYDFFNKHFVCVKYDMEQEEGLALKKRYGIVGYPTFFILNEKGEVLHKFMGYYSAEDMIKEGMKHNDNLYSSVALERRYAEGERGKKLLYEYLLFLYKGLDVKKIKVAEELYEQLSDEEKVLEKYWMLFSYPDLAPYGSKNVVYLLKNYNRFCASIDETQVEKKVSDLFLIPLRGMLRENSVSEEFIREKLPQMEKDIQYLPAEIREYIQLYIDIVHNFSERKFVDIVGMCERKLERLPNNGGIGIYMELMDSVCKNVSVDQRKNWFTLGERLIKNVENANFQKRVRYMIQQYE